MLSLILAVTAATTPCPAGGNGDSAIRRVEECVCYKSVQGQQLKPWQLAWDNAEKLREQLAHCECKVTIDLKAVENPRRYLVPGIVVK